MIETPSTKWNPAAKIASQTSGRAAAASAAPRVGRSPKGSARIAPPSSDTPLARHQRVEGAAQGFLAGVGDHFGDPPLRLHDAAMKDDHRRFVGRLIDE